MRFYFTAIRINGTGVAADTFYCPLHDHQASPYQFLDGREYQEIEDGWLFVWTNNTAQEHADLIAQTDVTYLPIEDINGLSLALDDLVSDISAANRAIIIAEFRSRGIPTSGITGTMTIRESMRIVVARVRLIENLIRVDFSGVLEDTVSSIPAKRKKALRKRLTNLGYDVAPITNIMTVEEALIELLSQNKIPNQAFPF